MKTLTDELEIRVVMDNLKDASANVEKLVTLLERFEFDREKPSAGSITLVVLGALSFGIGVFLIGGVVIWITKLDAGALSNILVAVGAILIALGLILIVFGLPDRGFRAVSSRMQKFGGVGTLIFQFVLLVLAAFCSFIICGLFLSEEIQAINWTVIVTCGAIELFCVYGIYTMGSGPINVGINSIRRKFSVRVFSAAIETAAFASVFACFCFAIGAIGDSWTGTALAVFLALVSYFSFKMKILDDAFNATSKLFFEIRNSSWRSFQDAGGDRAIESRRGVTDAYRELMAAMNQTPTFSRKPVNFFGIRALCLLADAKEIGVNSSDTIIIGEKRIEAGNDIINMPDKDFCFASAVVFDALTSMVGTTKSSKEKMLTYDAYSSDSCKSTSRKQVEKKTLSELRWSVSRSPLMLVSGS